MAGFLLFLYPLKWLKFNPERLAVRLWLTLHYVEMTPPLRSISDFLASLDQIEVAVAGPDQIRFDLPEMTWRDGLVILLLCSGFLLL